MRAFAGEILSVVLTLSLFCDCVLRPAGVLLDHCDCMDMMRLIIDILHISDHSKVSMLANAFARYHVVYAA